MTEKEKLALPLEADSAGEVGKALQKSNLFIKDLEAIANFSKHFQPPLNPKL